MLPAPPPHPAFGPDAPVYLDHNATTPVDPRVAEAMRAPLAEAFGNPSSAHAYGTPARALLDEARGRVTGLIGADAGRLVFTGSGSEADALAVRGAVLQLIASGPGRWREERPHVITQPTEHPAVLAACEYLLRWHGAEVTLLGVDEQGRVDPDELRAVLTDRTLLVSVMHANNETGTIQPIAELARITHESPDALFHTDAAQTVAKVPVDVEALGVDLLTLVGHKMYAPKGIGALWVRDGVRLEPIVAGGGQEGGLRAGTENLPHAVALGAAAALASADLAADEPARLAALRDRLHAGLDAALPGRVRLNGHPVERLPHTLNVSLDGVDARALLALAPGVAASTGSACHAGATTPSPVLTGMGLDAARAFGALRLSLGRWTTEDDIDRAVALLAAAAADERAAATVTESAAERARRLARRTLPLITPGG
nr:cysteine desulfurase [Propionibacterium sp.]